MFQSKIGVGSPGGEARSPVLQRRSVMDRGSSPAWRPKTRRPDKKSTPSGSKAGPGTVHVPTHRNSRFAMDSIEQEGTGNHNPTVQCPIYYYSSLPSYKQREPLF